MIFEIFRNLNNIKKAIHHFHSALAYEDKVFFHYFLFIRKMIQIVSYWNAEMERKQGEQRAQQIFQTQLSHTCC